MNKYWRPAGGVENHAFEVKAALEAMGHEVFPYAMREPETLPTPFMEYFPSAVDFRSGSPGAMARSVGRAAFAKGAKANFEKFLEVAQIDAAYVLHIYHQLGMPLLNSLHNHHIPTVLSLHDYKVACPNYRLFSERTQSICTKCLDKPAGHLWAPIQERCWNDSAVAGAALVIESAATRMHDSYNKADIITTLNDLQEVSIRRAGVHVPIMRLPHPVELGPARPAQQRKHFVYVGRLVPEKGVATLIRAVARAGVTLRIVGDGRSRNDLEQLSSALNASVHFVGNVSSHGVERELADAIALVVPSEWHEVSPLVVYEAIAADVPVVATAVGGMIDQLGDGRGRLVPVNDVEALASELKSVNDDQFSAQNASARAREHALRYHSPATWKANLAAVFGAAGVTL